MHTLSVPCRFDFSPKDFVDVGDYFVEDVNGSQILQLCNGGKMNELRETKPFDETKDWNGKRILFMRVGGYGDLIMLTPVLREVRRRWPTATIHVSTMDCYSQVLKNLPFVDETIGYPVRTEVADSYDAWVFFENAIENNPRAQKVQMSELFAEITGLTGITDFKPEYQPTKEEITWALVGFPRNPGVRRVCVQCTASAKARVYPHAQLSQVLTTLVKNGWEVFLMGAEGEIGAQEVPGLRNLSGMKLTFRQSCAVINSADCVLAPDSALLHVGGALGIPAVGLYAPFPWELRTKHCPTTFALQGRGDCAPCFHHARKNFEFPPHCPSAKRGVCEVLERIDPRTVVAKIEKMAKTFSFDVVE